MQERLLQLHQHLRTRLPRQIRQPCAFSASLSAIDALMAENDATYRYGRAFGTDRHGSLDGFFDNLDLAAFLLY